MKVTERATRQPALLVSYEMPSGASQRARSLVKRADPVLARPKVQELLTYDTGGHQAEEIARHECEARNEAPVLLGGNFNSIDLPRRMS